MKRITFRRRVSSLTSPAAGAALLAVASIPASASITVSNATVEDGVLLITGKSTTGSFVILDRAIAATPINPSDKKFSFGVDDYLPTDCIVDLSLADAPETLSVVIANCGPRGLNPRGVWSSSEFYQTDDIVTFNGSSWRALPNPTLNVGNIPDAGISATFWEKFVSKGLDGAPGPVGPQGVQGELGQVGAAGPQGAVGPQGEQGVMGVQGPQGAEGPAGASGEIGPQGPTGVTGPQGPAGINATNGLRDWRLRTGESGSGIEVSKAVVAVCSIGGDIGWKPIGGGYISTLPDAFVFESAPFVNAGPGYDSWIVRAHKPGNTSNWSITAYAICARE